MLQDRRLSLRSSHRRADQGSDARRERHGEGAPEGDAGGGLEHIGAPGFRPDRAEQREEEQRGNRNG